MPPTKGTEAKKRAAANWKDADNHKLTQLLKPIGKIDPHDHSKANIQKLHENWPNKPYKSFATLVRGKLEKICAGEAIDGARRAKKRVKGKTLIVKWRILLFCSHV
jgi:hypothetical protein